MRIGRTADHLGYACLRKIMHKIFSVSFCLALVLSLTACGTNDVATLLGADDEEDSGETEHEEVVFADDETQDFHDNLNVYVGEDPTSVVTFYLTASPGEASDNTNHTWSEVSGLRDSDYERMGVGRYSVNCLLQVGDEQGPVSGEFGYGLSAPNGTVSIRGQSSAEQEQKNFKIKLNKKAGTWNGQRIINLNKHVADGSRFRNKLCFDLLKGLDHTVSLQTQFVHLYVRDLTSGGDGKFHDYGLYTQVEQPNKTFLQAHGLDRNGQLYKVNYFEFYRYEDDIVLKSDDKYDKSKFESHLEIKGDDDHSKLIAMLTDVNDLTVPIQTVLDKWFDEDNVLTFLAFNILMGNIDTQSRNCLLYSPLNGSTFYFINWDCDGAFDGLDKQIRGAAYDPAWQRGVSNYWGNVLFQRMLKDEEIQKELDAKVTTMKQYLDEKLPAMIDSYAAVARPFAYSEPDVEHELLTSDQYDQMIAAEKSAVDTYYQAYLDSLQKPMPFFTGKPVNNGSSWHFGWDTSYDFQAQNISYTFALSQKASMDDPLVRQEGIYTGEFDWQGTLAPGQYFVKVDAEDTDGNTQGAFDTYRDSEGVTYPGVLTFFVDADGTVRLEGE